jgi:hypothetical protein
MARGFWVSFRVRAFRECLPGAGNGTLVTVSVRPLCLPYPLLLYWQRHPYRL